MEDRDRIRRAQSLLVRLASRGKEKLENLSLHRRRSAKGGHIGERICLRRSPIIVTLHVFERRARLFWPGRLESVRRSTLAICGTRRRRPVPDCRPNTPLKIFSLRCFCEIDSLLQFVDKCQQASDEKEPTI